VSQAFDSAAFLRTLTSRPGVYRMFGAEGQLLYVGKARDLKRRVSSYFSRSNNARVQAMVSQIRAIEVTVTHTEAEALLLENNLIKAHKPRYNILLRDSKGYPYIHLSAGDYPRLSFHRGSRSGGGRFFGPYPTAGSVREPLLLLQKLFPVRQCEDSYFRARSRPCLQYQIKRCTAPCVGLISPEDYARDVADIENFLEGRTQDVIAERVRRMEAAAARLEFEDAARYRDQIEALRAIQERQYVSGERGDLDLIACATEGGEVCIQVFFIRRGRNLGNRSYFPRAALDETPGDILTAFLGQFYLEQQAPREIILSDPPSEAELLAEALGGQAGHKVRFSHRVRGERARWLRMARNNAEVALKSRLASAAGMRARFEALADALGLDEPPERMECFDISHTAGELPVASCVVFNGEGALKSDYRRFNIRDITPGDDYAAMRQALERRYRRLRDGEGRLPDILFIDGGKGQVKAVAEVLDELGIHAVLLCGVAKGPDRRPGQEQLILLERDTPLILPAHSPALHLIQQIRDEAHRFAVSGHRQRRARGQGRSSLEEIPGVGPKKRQRLLKEFGGLQGVARAGIEDLVTVAGIDRELATRIYDSFHGSD